MENDNYYFLHMYMYNNNQYGGGLCSICNAPGVNKSTCPLNPNSINPKPIKPIKPIKQIKQIKQITSVVNVKVKYIRPQFQNLKEWTQDPNNVYIGRPGIVFIDKERFPKKGSIWANPFKVSVKLTRKDSLEKYEIYIREKIETEAVYKELLQLNGKNLGCWCKPEECHGDILLKILKEALDK